MQVVSCGVNAGCVLLLEMCRCRLCPVVAMQVVSLFGYALLINTGGVLLWGCINAGGVLL